MWQALFAALVDVSVGDAQAIDSTSIKAHRCAAGGKEGPNPGYIGRSRGGRTPKVHAAADGQGRIAALEVTPGQLGDRCAALTLLSSCPRQPACCRHGL